MFECTYIYLWNTHAVSCLFFLCIFIDVPMTTIELNQNYDNRMQSLHELGFLPRAEVAGHCDSLRPPISTCDEKPPEAAMAGRCRAEQLESWRLKRRRKLTVW